ncbi:hypothetical protein BHE74_00015068 [Ensete ventricosum]|nr:hypothetical protein GW17_00017364 [Ensete ventricosum]RWW76815.1 hypothetical protein BHE74_00015068 [Ensete ventricosum]RZR88065.1 hypothetical protein BHM03_00015571 [Ensete ventricosum]
MVTIANRAAAVNPAPVPLTSYNKHVRSMAKKAITRSVTTSADIGKPGRKTCIRSNPGLWISDLGFRGRHRRVEGSRTYGEEADREGEGSDQEEDEEAENAPESLPQGSFPFGLGGSRHRRRDQAREHAKGRKTRPRRRLCKGFRFIDRLAGPKPATIYPLKLLNGPRSFLPSCGVFV